MNTKPSAKRTTMTTLNTQKGKYSSIIATSAHQPVTNLTFFRPKWACQTMGFFFKGKDIGYGDLTRRVKKNHLHTDNVSLRKRFRRKGHGINLYIHLIESARKIGAKRIYSSTTLNKFSRRMWKEKLAKIYEVHTVRSNVMCNRCECRNRRETCYYIELN